MGPMKLMGKIFATIGTAVESVETVVVNTDKLLKSGFHAIDIAVNGGIEELKTDDVVAAAHRRVRAAEANKEAAKVVAELDAGN